MNSTNKRVYLDIAISNKQAGRMVVELFWNCPRTVDNFIKLCTGECGTVDVQGSTFPLTIRNTLFHRIIPGFMAQGGDFTKNNGNGGWSIYGQKFDDENFIHKHNAKGMLSMANSGKNTNGSQFFITFKAASWLDNKHVVFGKVVEGLDVLDKIEACGTKNGKPTAEVKLYGCGLL